MGDICNPFSPIYDPLACGQVGGFPFQPGGGSGPTSIEIINVPPPVVVPIDITIPLSLGTTIATALGGIIGKSLTEQSANLGKVLTTINTAITGALATAILNVGNFVGKLTTGLTDGLSRLDKSVTAVSTAINAAIGTGVVTVLKTVKDVLVGIGEAIKTKFSELIAEIHKNGAASIIPVLTGIITEVRNIQNIVHAIENATKSGAIGALQIASATIEGIKSLDATLTRTMQQIGFTTGAKIGTDVTFPNAPLPPEVIGSFWSPFLSGSGQGSSGVAWTDIQKLLTTCMSSEAVVDIQDIQNRFANSPGWIQDLGNALKEVLVAGAVLFSHIEKQTELGAELANKICPIKKLDPGTAVQAALRHFISPESLREELRVQGYDDARIATLLNLASQRIDVGTLLDSYHRGLITANDLQDGLFALYYTDAQQAILREQSFAVPTAADILRWKDFKLIDETQARTRLQQLHFPQHTIDNMLQSYKTRETVSQQIQLHGRLEASGQGWIPVASRQPQPQEVVDAAAREQVTESNTQLQWLAHWSLPSWLVILQGYFRNLRTLKDVELAMTAENIPQEFWDELIKVNRPLLPMRSIPAYIRAGILSDGDAILELSGHGFDPLHISWILDFAHKAANKGTASAVATVEQLSVQTARTLFDDGVITQEQYIQVLVAHKFPADVAALQAQADALAAHAKQRKQQLTDMVNEVLAGVITVDDALATLTQQGFTQAELARFQNGIKKQRTVNTKHPSISEMKTFLKAQLITLDQFKEELQLQGWTSPWLDAWIQLETP